MKAKLTKFNDDGTHCKTDIEYLKKHPECGVIFIQDKPFKPNNPSHKFRPHDRNFSIDILDRTIPRDPNIDPPPVIGDPPLIGGAVGSPPFTNVYLPQDYTNYQLAGRRLLGEHLEYTRLGGYTTLPVANAETDIPFPVKRIGNDSYSHETPQRPTRPVGEVELEDFGAGVGIQNDRPPPIRQTRIRPLADPRDDEFVLPRGMTDEEQIELQRQQVTRYMTSDEALVETQMFETRRNRASDEGLIETQMFETKRRVTLPRRRKPVPDIEGTELVAIEPEKEEELIIREAERFVRKGRPTISQREAEQIADQFATKGISKLRVFNILEEFELYDAQGEFELQAIADPRERAMVRRMRAQRIIQRDSNLLPEPQRQVTLPREDTPLITRERVASRLPENLRTLQSSVKRNAEAFNENVRTRSLEAIQNIRSRTTRVFGQSYKSLNIRGGDIELTAPEGNINIRPPVTEDLTGIRSGDLEAVEFNILGDDARETFIGKTRPKLTFAQRIQRAKAGAFTGETAVGGVGAGAGVLIGFGVAELMGKAGVDNKYAIAAGAGGAGGAGARILTMAGTKALTRGATTAVAETATYTAIRAGTSLLRGAAEGAVVGIALMPVDEALNHHFVNQGFSHTNANLASGLIAGGTATALTTIGLASLGAAPETLGASLVVGAVAMAATSVVGFFTGKEQDKKEKKIREAEEQRKKLISTAEAREKLLKILPNYNYNFDLALDGFARKSTLGIDDDTWGTFSKNARTMFVKRPRNTPPPTPTSGEPPTGEQKKINDLFSKYITHTLINRVCKGGADCTELRRHDQGELTDDEKKFLNDKTGSTWQSQANMQIEMSVQELNYTRQRMRDAQLEMLNAWNNDKKVANQLDPYVVQTACLDPTFRQRYDLALKLDAQQEVVDAYKDNQTRIEQLPKNIRDMANQDADFDTMIHHYYNTMETTAGQLDITVPQLIELQTFDEDTQKDKYQEMQFDNIKQNAVIVNEAKEISAEEDQVRDAGFYDIDQAYLETDPTAITSWHPSDSQILQAHSAGMNLNEYVEYMHQLSRGEAGDYSKLPKFTEGQLRASGLLDFSHFQDELQMAGFRKDLYLYDENTRLFTLNPNVTNNQIPSTEQTFISRYTPRYLKQARNEYADMIHGLNKQNQDEVDNYNNNLMKELSSYGKHYDSIVADINNERLYEGRSDLLFFNVGNVYNQNKLEFTALSDKLSDSFNPNVVSQNEATKRQLNPNVRAERKQEAAENYRLSVKQYDDMKRDIVSKGITNPRQQDIDIAVQEVKNAPDFAPPLAS